MEVPEGTRYTASRDRAILETLYSTGARVSELVGLNWNDVDVETGIVRLQGKGKKERIVPIGDIALEAIREYRSQQPVKPGQGTQGKETNGAQTGVKGQLSLPQYLETTEGDACRLEASNGW